VCDILQRLMTDTSFWVASHMAQFQISHSGRFSAKSVVAEFALD
jgi:hypothetical protein